MSATETTSEVNAEKLQNRKEIYIKIDLKGLRDAWKKLCYNAPVETYKWTMRQLDTAATKVRTGYLSVVTMPGGIMVRNASRVAHDLSDGRYAHGSEVVGGIGALAAWGGAGYVLSQTLAPYMAASAITSWAGTAGVYAAAAAVTFPLVVPAFTIGLLASATVVGAVAFVLSAAPAVLNVKPGLLRTLDAFKGVKYTDKDLELPVDQDSLRSRHDREMLSDIESKLYRLSDTSKEQLHKTLSDEFAEKAARAAEQQQIAQAAAVDKKAKPAAGR